MYVYNVYKHSSCTVPAPFKTYISSKNKSLCTILKSSCTHFYQQLHSIQQISEGLITALHIVKCHFTAY